jgi:hypothetical protein
VSIVAAAIATYINSSKIGDLLPLTRLAQVAYDASSAVINVTQLTVNGAATDLGPGDAGVLKVGTVSVS